MLRCRAASFRGYWREKAERTGDRRDRGQPDGHAPNAKLLPIDLTAHDGKTITPRELGGG